MLQSNSTKLDKIVWWIPLSYTADLKTIGTDWLSDQESKKEMTLDFDVASNQWLIFNVESTGKYEKDVHCTYISSNNTLHLYAFSTQVTIELTMTKKIGS